MKTIRELLGERRAYSVSPSDSVTEVVRYLVEKEIGAVAVCEDGKVLGVFSERDLMRRVVYEKRDLDSTPVSEVMTTPVFFISVDDQHDVAKALMVGKNLRHLVVLDEAARLFGFLSMRELLGADLD